jgi:hypothetical protein
MKSPMNQRPDEQAHLDTEAFIAKYSRKPGTEPVDGPAKQARKKKAASAPPSTT